MSIQERYRGAKRRFHPSSVLLALSALLVWTVVLLANPSPADASAGRQLGNLVVIAYNDLGMHCMNEDFSEICILPPANTLRATVIDRSESDPNIVTEGVTLEYSIPGNTVSQTKTNFWTYAQALFGVALPPDIGLTGKGLTGTMSVTADRDWIAQFIPVTPLTDTMINDPYQLAQVVLKRQGVIQDVTQNVIPVSWEIRCDKCHRPSKGMSVAMDILVKHDRLHGTNLVNQKPVLCASCHADPALGAPGVQGVKTMSAAMHGAHAKRFFPSTTRNPCYNCHPGNQAQCLRDVHLSAGLSCITCHGTMRTLGNPARVPWADEPKCGSCHHVSGHQYEQPGKLYRDSVGHSGVKCIVCHNSPHAITPTVTARDNLQSIRLQGHEGPIDTCTVCHRQQPTEPFFHRVND